jgi:uncharacterized damage-inducible protein DinB
MDAVDLLRGLFQHMAWADAALWRAVLGCEAARADPGIRRWLHHAHLAQRALVSVCRGEPFDLEAASVPLAMEHLAASVRRYDAEALPFVEGLTAGGLDRPVVLPWATRFAGHLGREPFPPALGEALMQVSSHTTHHRAQVSARLRQLGGEPPMTDYIAWIWFGRPAPEWPPET